MMRAIGLMSGTSMDGIDAAMIRTDGLDQIEIGPSAFFAYDASFQRRLRDALETAKSIDDREQRPGDLVGLEGEITRLHRNAVRAVMASNRAFGAPDIVGFHGQTVLHRPERALTVQLGDGAMLAQELGIPVVYDMRANDMRHGGQGAPLVPAYHAALARSRVAPDRYPAVFVNIGGISNVTWVPASGDPVAFDSGPGNALIDHWVNREGGVPYDAEGFIASEGGVVMSVVEHYLRDPFFQKRGPKSLDRNDFSLDLAKGLELSDGARTLANVSATAILMAAELMPEPPKLWILCGGGRKNPHIVADLRNGAMVMGAETILIEDLGLNGDFTEAEAWAYLAVRSVKALPLTFPSTTGCREAVTGGVRSHA